jgi:hypothetical protein
MIAIQNGYEANLNDVKVPENEIFESVADKQYIEGFHRSMEPCLAVVCNLMDIKKKPCQ